MRTEFQDLRLKQLDRVWLPSELHVPLPGLSRDGYGPCGKLWESLPANWRVALEQAVSFPCRWRRPKRKTASP